jgi:hypothetical protein
MTKWEDGLRSLRYAKAVTSAESVINTDVQAFCEAHNDGNLRPQNLDNFTNTLRNARTGTRNLVRM